MTPLRAATVADVPVLARVMAKVWPGEEVSAAQIARAIEDAAHGTLVAVVGGEVAGFVDSFATRPAPGTVRWEVDLLAVRPAFRGQRLGSALVRAATALGAERGASSARALVATGNVASQRAFSAAGYGNDGALHELYLSSGRNGAAPVRDSLLPVTTFRYEGLWIEPPWTADRFAAALAALDETGRDVAGAVLPLADPSVIEAARAAGYAPVERYHWWCQPLAVTHEP